MAKNLERKMVCKNCNQVEIGKDPTDNIWYEVNNDTQPHFYKCPNAPHKETKRSQYPPRGGTKDIDKLAVAEELKALKERLNTDEDEIRRLGEAIKALVGTSGGQATLG